MKFHLARINETVSFSEMIGTNAKLSKEVVGEAIRILGLTLAPSTQSGYNACAHSTPACRAACVLWFAGRRVMDEVRESAIARTKLWMLDRKQFLATLEKELISKSRKYAKQGESLWFRFNTASDIRVHRMPNVMETILPHVAGMYDYTAELARMDEYLDGAWKYPNYHLTFSVKEDTTASDVLSVLNRGGNVAMVVDTTYNPTHRKFGMLPASVRFQGAGIIAGKSRQLVSREFRVVDGDKHDLRTPHTDGKGAVVMLRLKGTNYAKQLAREYGFAKVIPALGVDSELSIADGKVATVCLN